MEMAATENEIAWNDHKMAAYIIYILSTDNYVTVETTRCFYNSHFASVRDNDIASVNNGMIANLFKVNQNEMRVNHVYVYTC